MTWSVVVPVKRLAVAKSRLADPQDPARNPTLALAFACDTVAAVVGSPAVARVIVVTDDRDVHVAVARLGATVHPDVRRGGLNAAVRGGATYVVGLAGRHPVATVPSDLPALTPEWLEAALAAAAEQAWAFVPDLAGSGTTLLTAAGGDLDPRYGPGSAARHGRAGAVRLGGYWPGLRLDVDTPEDLRAACSLGVGRHTATVLAAAPALCQVRP